MNQQEKTKKILDGNTSTGFAIHHLCELTAMLIDRFDGFFAGIEAVEEFKLESPGQEQKKNVRKVKVERVPVKAIVDLWNGTVQFLPKVKTYKSIESSIRGRWKEHKQLQDLQKWKEIFIYADSNNWLSGSADGSTWNATLDWVVKRQNMEKIINGFYQKHGFRNGYSPKQ